VMSSFLKTISESTVSSSISQLDLESRKKVRRRLSLKRKRKRRKRKSRTSIWVASSVMRTTTDHTSVVSHTVEHLQSEYHKNRLKVLRGISLIELRLRRFMSE